MESEEEQILIDLAFLELSIFTFHKLQVAPISVKHDEITKAAPTTTRHASAAPSIVNQSIHWQGSCAYTLHQIAVQRGSLSASLDHLQQAISTVPRESLLCARVYHRADVALSDSVLQAPGVVFARVPVTSLAVQDGEGRIMDADVVVEISSACSRHQ